MSNESSTNRDQEMIEHLRATENDPERAHTIEDDLLWRVVHRVIARDYEGALSLAKALDEYDGQNQDRTRWYA